MCLPDQDTGQYKCNHFSKMNLTASTQHLSLSGVKEIISMQWFTC